LDEHRARAARLAHQTLHRQLEIHAASRLLTGHRHGPRSQCHGVETPTATGSTMSRCRRRPR
jgi:hypothetical protein